MVDASRVRAAVFAKDLNRGEEATLVITVAASFPMVAFYAYFIEPGHPQEFYNEAALWIGPWSSYVLGPVCFLAFNFWLARRSPERNAMVFAAATIGLYVLLEIAMMPMHRFTPRPGKFPVTVWMKIVIEEDRASKRAGVILTFNLREIGKSALSELPKFQ